MARWRRNEYAKKANRGRPSTWPVSRETPLPTPRYQEAYLGRAAGRLDGNTGTCARKVDMGRCPIPRLSRSRSLSPQAGPLSLIAKATSRKARHRPDRSTRHTPSRPGQRATKAPNERQEQDTISTSEERRSSRHRASRTPEKSSVCPLLNFCQFSL